MRRGASDGQITEFGVGRSVYFEDPDGMGCEVMLMDVDLTPEVVDEAVLARASTRPRASRGRVLLAGVLPVLELDDAHLLEAAAQPRVVAVEQAELLAVRHDLGEQHLLEQLAGRVAEHEGHDVRGFTPMRSHTSWDRKRSRIRTAAS